MPRYLITSALPYINGVKHLGNLVGSMLPGDVYARYLRACGEEVLYVCATDEHGTPAELAALDAGQSVDEYCSEQHEIQRVLGERFALSFDVFGRSSSAQNRELTQHFADRLQQNGFIEDRVTKQIYSPADGRFLPDRYVVGTCPHCGFDRARGDQCENCTRVLEPTALLNARSAVSGSSDLEVRETRHLFLQLGKLEEELRGWIDGHPDWPILTTSIARKWLGEGLRERAITRDLSWGVPVNRPGYENKVFYVWFDAPIEYIGATREWADAAPEQQRDWRSWWFDARDVHHVQFMAKDNVPFHTIMWPGTIMATREPWKLADYVKGYNWLTYYGGKFSTSQGRGVFMDTALDPESDDSDFTWEAFATGVNKDLAGTFGNFVNRTLRLTEKNFGLTVPEGGEIGDEERQLATELSERLTTLNRAMDEVQFRKAAAELYLIWQMGNGYLARREPWKLVAEKRDEAAAVLRTAINLIRINAILAAPFIPDTCTRVLAALGEDPGPIGSWFADGTDLVAELEHLRGGGPFAIPDVLFPRVTDEQVATWTERFAGSEMAQPSEA
jgi:methionyl-tRNA synthetase